MASETEQLIDSLCEQFRNLLNTHWIEFWSYRSAEKPAKGTLSFSIDCRRLDYEVVSQFGFGIRLKHETRALIDSPAKIQLKLDDRGNGQKEKAAPVR